MSGAGRMTEAAKRAVMHAESRDRDERAPASPEAAHQQEALNMRSRRTRRRRRRKMKQRRRMTTKRMRRKTMRMTKSGLRRLAAPLLACGVVFGAC